MSNISTAKQIPKIPKYCGRVSNEARNIINDDETILNTVFSSLIAIKHIPA